MQNKVDRYNAILLVDKPSGMTSHDVVAKLRRILSQRRIGHTGTLDKSATGLLVVCLGKATKAAQFISDADKKYQAGIQLGRRSKTYDAEGVDFSKPEETIPQLTENDMTNYLSAFQGEINQTVPAYSAVHVDGERLYKLAAKGIDVELPERKVVIYDIDISSYNNNELQLTVSCSKGTYIRSIAHDLGETIGCGAYLSELRRLKVGQLLVENSYTIEQIDELHQADKLDDRLLNYKEVLTYASCSIDDGFVESIFHGKDISVDHISKINGSYESGDKVCVTDSYGNVLAVCKAEIASSEINKENDNKLFSYIRVLN